MARLLEHPTPKSLVIPVTTDSIRLQRQGQYVQVIPAVAGLEPVFYSVRHVAWGCSGHASEVEPIIEPLVWTGKDSRRRSRQWFFAGLEPLVQEIFQRAGIKVNLTGWRPSPLPAPDLAHLDGFPAVDRELLDFVRRQDRGLIRYSPAGRVHPARLVAQIVLAWRRKRIIVAVTRVDDARRIVRWLRHYGVEATLFTDRHRNRWSHRVVVSTYAQLGRGPVAIHRCRICLALNPSELFDGYLGFGLEVIRHLPCARLFGLLPEGKTLAPRLRDLITALFGVEEVHIPRHGCRPVPVEVVFLLVEGGGRLPDCQDVYAVKRAGVHEHPVRNRRIRRLAQALAHNDRQLLQDRFPEVAARLGDHDTGRVGVLVDSVEHGLTLARLLSWPLVASENVNEQGLAEQDLAVLFKGMGRISVKQPVVATGEGLARAGRFDVLIRADGGTGLPALPSTMLRQPHHKDRRLLLIDFRDRHHPVLRQWSRQRLESYQDQGWSIAGNEMTPLDRFLATRPTVWAPEEASHG